MSRPLLLDLFCGAGGAAMGYHRAGFDVIGVDIEPMPDYPFEFHQGDAMAWPLEGFDAVHASPPCKAFTVARHRHKVPHPDLLTPTLECLRSVAVPWVVENVPGSPMPPTAVTYCGSSFGLAVRRHRLFASNVALMAPPCAHHLQPVVLGVYGTGGAWKRKAPGGGGQKVAGRDAANRSRHRSHRAPSRAVAGDPARVHRAHRAPAARAHREGGGMTSTGVRIELGREATLVAAVLIAVARWADEPCYLISDGTHLHVVTNADAVPQASAAGAGTVPSLPSPAPATLGGPSHGATASRPVEPVAHAGSGAAPLVIGGVKPYECDHCGERFGSKQGRSGHIGAKHPFSKTKPRHDPLPEPVHVVIPHTRRTTA